MPEPTLSPALVEALQPIADTDRARDAEAGLPTDLTEDGLALAFTARTAERLRFCATLGGWMVHRDACWQKDEVREPYRQARILVREKAQSPDLSPAQRTKLRSAAVVNSIVSLASSDPVHAITQEVFDADPWQLNTPGGLVDLRTGVMRSGQPTDYCTKVASVAPGGDALRWRQFLQEVTGDDADLISYLHRLVGYWLTGVTTEHALVFVYGTGGNGKSVFLNTISQLLGSYARQAPMALFEQKTHDGHPTELAMLRGSRLVVANETEEGRSWAESRVKALTGGDPITARFMHRDFFTYTPQFKPVIAGNHRPRFRNVDDALRRRLHLVPFTQRFVNPDRELPARLHAEAGGILAWAIEGCLAWQRDGLQPPDTVRLATDEYLEQEDSVGMWLTEACLTAPNAWSPSADLWRSWEQWANQRGEFVGSQKRLAEWLVARGFVPAKDRSGSRRGFRGLNLREESDASGHIRQSSAFPASHAHTHARAHDARARRLNAEHPPDVSGAFPCVVCQDPLKLFGVAGVVCMDCRAAQDGAV